MAVMHMKRSPERGTEFPTECGAITSNIVTEWSKVTCNNCIRKFGPKDAKDQYKEKAKEKGVKVQVSYTPEEKSVDKVRMDLEGLLNGIRSQSLRLEGVKMSIEPMMGTLALIDEESITELLHCVEYLEAAMSNLVTIKGMVFTKLHGHTIEEEYTGEKVS